MVEQVYNVSLHEVRSGGASMSLYSHIGFMVDPHYLKSHETEYILNALNDFNNIHKDNEILLYKLLHISNVIRERFNLTPLKIEDVKVLTV